MSRPKTSPRPADSLLSSPLSEEDAAEAAHVLKALAHPVRLRLISVIAAQGEACACDFPELLGKAQPTVSHHLTQLVNAGILQREQRGKWAWFSIDTEGLAQVIDELSSLQRGPARVV